MCVRIKRIALFADDLRIRKMNPICRTELLKYMYASFNALWKKHIVCGQVDIGNAGTEMTARMKQGVLQADGKLAVEPTMDVQNVASAVLYMDSLTLDANVLFMTIMANKMPFVGRG